MIIKLISLIVPAYRQEKTIVYDLRRIKRVLDKLRYPSELICVVDGKDDNTFRNAWKFAKNDPDIKVIDGKACPACLNIMQNLTSKLVGLRGEEINLIIGSIITDDMLKGKERLVALGGCAIKKLQDLRIETIAKIDENIDDVEQLMLLKKLLVTEGTPKITPVDKVKSKMKKLLSKVIG